MKNVSTDDRNALDKEVAKLKARNLTKCPSTSDVRRKVRHGGR